MRPIPPELLTTAESREGLTHAGETSSWSQINVGDETFEGDSEAETESEYGQREEPDSEDDDSEDDDSELDKSDLMDFENEGELAGGGNVAVPSEDNDGTDAETESTRVGSEVEEGEFHDAVFYYFDGELEALEQQDAQTA